jgi:hypothetical protein
MDSTQKTISSILISEKIKNQHWNIDKNLSKELFTSLQANDIKINEELKIYANNRKLIDSEDPTIKDIEETLGFITSDDSSIETKQKWSIKKIVWQVRNLEKRNKDFLNNYEIEKSKFSPKAQEAIKTIEKESWNKIKVIVDKELTRNFRSIMGISYRWWAYLGQYIVVDDPKVFEDEDFLRHEAIHCAQQRDLWVWKLWFLRWTIISFTSLLKKRAQIRWLDEDVDYWTDNQITDFETYLNQFKKWYLRTRKPGAWKKYKNENFRKQEMNQFKEDEIQLLKNKRNWLIHQLSTVTEDVPKRSLELEIEKITWDISQYENILKKLKEIDEILVVMIKQDIQWNKKEDTREQVLFESKKNRDIRIPIEEFIQKNGDKKDNYKKWVELWIEQNKKSE